MVSYKTYCGAYASVTTTGSLALEPSPTGGAGNGNRSGDKSGGVRSVSSSSWFSVLIITLVASMISLAVL